MGLRRNNSSVSPITCRSPPIDPVSINVNEDRGKYTPRRRSTSPRSNDNVANPSSNNSKNTTYFIGFLGVLLLFYIGVYPAMRSSYHFFYTEQGTVVLDSNPVVQSSIHIVATLEPTTSPPTTSKQTTFKSTTWKSTTSKDTTSELGTAKPSTFEQTTSKPSITKQTASKLTKRTTTEHTSTFKPTTWTLTTSTIKQRASKPTTSKQTTFKPTTSEQTTSKPATTTSKLSASKPTTSTSKPTTTKPTGLQYSTSLTSGQPQLKSQTKPTKSLPDCAFLRMDLNELSAQSKQEYNSVKDFKLMPRGAVALYGTTPNSTSACVNNPLMQRLSASDNNTPMNSLLDPTLILASDKVDNYNKTINLPECASKGKKTGTVSQLQNDPLWVISMETTTTTLSETSFEQAGFNPEVTSAVNGKEMMKECIGKLSGGVLGIRLSFRKLLLRALREGHERVIIVEDDVVLEDDFSKNLNRHLQAQRCGGFMFDDSTGGVLLLGSSEYGGVDLMKAGLNDPKDKCYNVNGFTYGAYASVYHRNVFLPILAWLDAPKFELFPLDHVYKHLALRGFIVRVLKPMAALADVIHSSSTTERKRTFSDKLDVAFLIWRSCLMHWDLSKFEHYRTFFQARQLFDFTREKYCKRTEDSIVNYFNMHQAVVLIHTTPDLASLASLADILVARWQAKLDGRYEGYIARPFIVIEAPPGMPPMEMNEILSVVHGMRTQSFDAHLARVEKALEIASTSSSLDVAIVVHKLIHKALSPVLVLNSHQLEGLKRTLFKEPIAEVFLELRAKTPWVPTDTQIIELLERTKPRGRHWYTLDVDPSYFPEVDKKDSKNKSTSTVPKLWPQLDLNWLDVQHAASKWLDMIHKYSDSVSTVSHEILGLSQGTAEREKENLRRLEKEFMEHVVNAESLNCQVQNKKKDLPQAAVFAHDIEMYSYKLYALMKDVEQVKKNIHIQGVFFKEAKRSA